MKYKIYTRFVKKSTPKDLKVLCPNYSINMEHFITTVQVKNIEKIIESKFGQYYSRIFRLINSLGFLDEKLVLLDLNLFIYYFH